MRAITTNRRVTIKPSIFFKHADSEMLFQETVPNHINIYTDIHIHTYVSSANYTHVLYNGKNLKDIDVLVDNSLL